MDLTSDFYVPAGSERTWKFLLDPERVAACMPGAELTEVIDESSWKGRVRVRLGPVSLSFAGKVHLEDVDANNHRAVLRATGREGKGRGMAEATVTSLVTAVGDGCKVELRTELKLSGAIAQYGRGLIQDATAQLVDEFANCLAAKLSAGPERAGEAIHQSQRALSGFSLLALALRRMVRRLFGSVRRRSGIGKTGK